MTAMDGGRRKLMRRPEREQSILAAATRAFAQRGFAATSMEDVAAEAGVTKLIIYRHFAGKQDLYLAVLDRVRARMREVLGAPEQFGETTLAGLLQVAREDPDGFRLLFQHAANEPEFAHFSRQFMNGAADVTAQIMARWVTDPALLQWTARMVPQTVIEAVLIWLEVGNPAQDGEMLERLRHVLAAIGGEANPPREPPARRRPE